MNILDDNGLPQLEGDERFELVLRTPINAGLTRPHKAVITITDVQSDSKYCRLRFELVLRAPIKMRDSPGHTRLLLQ